MHPANVPIVAGNNKAESNLARRRSLGCWIASIGSVSIRQILAGNWSTRLGILSGFRFALIVILNPLWDADIAKRFRQMCRETNLSLLTYLLDHVRKFSQVKQFKR